MAKAFLGYNFAGPVSGSVIPQRLQNLCIRDYAATKQLTLEISVTEYFDPRNALMLFTQFDYAERIGGFVFFSVTLLPEDFEKRQRFFALLEKFGLHLHFALENICVTQASEFKWIEGIYHIRRDTRLDETRAALIALGNPPQKLDVT